MYYTNPIYRNDQIIRVNGINGANALALAPNSSALALDENSDTLFLCQTDGAGYKSVKQYMITPKEEPKIANYEDLEKRIQTIERYIVAYNNLSEIRSLESSMSQGFANSQKCCCEIQRGIDSVNYNGAINTASINANTTAQTQKILDTISANKIQDLQSQIYALQMQNNMAGVMRFPMAQTYSVPSPCYNTCGNI